MTTIADRSIMETCRGRNCTTMALRCEMVKASRVLGDDRPRRGWFCRDCAIRMVRQVKGRA